MEVEESYHYDHAVSYALTMIKWLFIINASALLILMGVTGSMVSREVTMPATTITFLTYIYAYSIFFIGGLILVIASSIFGYLTHISRVHNFKAYRRHQLFSLMLAVGSLAAFVFGIISCMYAFNDMANS